MQRAGARRYTHLHRAGFYQSITGYRLPITSHQFLDDQRQNLWNHLIMAKYSAAQTKAGLRFRPEWTKKGSTMMRPFQSRHFSTASEFATAVARLAKRAS